MASTRGTLDEISQKLGMKNESVNARRLGFLAVEWRFPVAGYSRLPLAEDTLQGFFLCFYLLQLLFRLGAHFSLRCDHFVGLYITSASCGRVQKGEF